MAATNPDLARSRSFSLFVSSHAKNESENSQNGPVPAIEGWLSSNFYFLLSLISTIYFVFFLVSKIFLSFFLFISMSLAFSLSCFYDIPLVFSTGSFLCFSSVPRWDFSLFPAFFLSCFYDIPLVFPFCVFPRLFLWDF